MSHDQPYAGLSPDCVLDAVEQAGFAPDGRLLALNSFENRVYQIGIEAEPGQDRFLIAKFYRPGRWSDAGIGEEHRFASELKAAELPVVAPLATAAGSLHRHAGFRFALFPRRGGRAPELEQIEVAAWLGRLLARIHNVGALARFQHRQNLDVENLLRAPMRAALASTLLPAELRERYTARVQAAATAIEQRLAAIAPTRLRLHGDCHPGNVLWTDGGPHFVDLDDARSGPAVQDLWMLFSGDEHQREALLEGYETFRPFDRRELDLIPALRLMRQIHYAGWIAERWSDPAFPQAFGHLASPVWWQQHLDDIAAQLESLEDADE
ncbi:MAG: serine/threonine protein kinase [Lysobacterales bacterium]